MTTHDSAQPDDHDLGLLHDLQTLRARRRVLGMLGLAGAGTLLPGCDLFGLSANAQSNRITSAADGTSCINTPDGTAGPFPADGTTRSAGKTLNVLTKSGIIREDLRPSFDGMTPVAPGTPLALQFQLVDVGNACAPLADRLIYLWHCDAAGRYSIYEDADRNYLRGVGISDANGIARFTSIMPGCYGGRWPHIHFEVFTSAEAAASGRDSVLTSQVALPGDVTRDTYAADDVYAASASSLARLSLARDGVFAASTPEQLTAQTMAFSRDASGGLSASVTVGLG
jgi:protocatechuate 3,4-dioxygenase beta subunit